MLGENVEVGLGREDGMNETGGGIGSTTGVGRNPFGPLSDCVELLN